MGHTPLNVRKKKKKIHFQNLKFTLSLVLSLITIRKETSKLYRTTLRLDLTLLSKMDKQMFKNKHNTEVMDLKLEVVHKQHTGMTKLDLENLDESIFNKELNLSNFSKPKPEVKRIKRKNQSKYRIQKHPK